VDIRLDSLTFLTAAAAAAVVVPLCGFLPALRAARTDPMTVLRRSSASGSLARVGWPGRILVMGQVALSSVLLTCAAITASAGLRLAHYPFGFDPAGLFTAKLSLYAIHGIDDAKPDQQARFYFRALERVRDVPGVQAASVTSALPTQVRASRQLILPGEEGLGRRRTVRWLDVSPGFAATLGIPVLRGRDLSPSDTATSPSVALVNRAFVKNFLKAGSGIGAQVGFFAPGQERPKWTTIVGILGDSAMTLAGEADEPEALYVPLSQRSDLGTSLMYLVVRSTEPPAALSRAISREIRAAEPDLAMWEPESLTQVIRREIWTPRAFTGLFGVFALGATLLACSSLYSIVALEVRRRRRELGIRVALGARPRDLLSLVGGQGAVDLIAGFLAGGVIAYVLARRLAGVFGSHSPEPVLWVVSAGILVSVGVAALLLPMRSITRSCPASLLHEDLESG
jgi:predicted permease